DAIEDIERHSFPRPWPRASFEAELVREHAHLVVVHVPHVVAFSNFWVVVGELHIHSIATHPDHRRGGIGARLVEHMIDVARAAACTLATLEVRCGNAPAIALYERAGFRTVTVRARYYQDNHEDARVMTREL
nr:ribosomal protein S18-alanine N-acetyltransferase [Deltaproteobacteria bacterium]